MTQPPTTEQMLGTNHIVGLVTQARKLFDSILNNAPKTWDLDPIAQWVADHDAWEAKLRQAGVTLGPEEIERLRAVATRMAAGLAHRLGPVLTEAAADREPPGGV